MSLKQALLIEFEYEATSTRKMLQNLPTENLSWKPSEKSLSIGDLALHIANMVGWVNNTINDVELDFAKGYTPSKVESRQQILDTFENNLTTATKTLTNVEEGDLNEMWTLRKGDVVYFTLPRKAVLRSMVYNHIVHHRGQLSVYYRLLGIPVPGMYGPSADEK